MPGKDKVDTVVTSHRRKRINYLAIATRWNASVINLRRVGECVATHLKEGQALAVQ